VPTVALFDWCHLLEDFLDNLGVSFDKFRTAFRGSWIFGYADALQRAGVRPICVYVSARVSEPWRFVHEPTGCSVCVLPSPRVYRAIRRRMANPYAFTVEKAVGPVGPISRPFFAAIKDVAPYLTTPVRWLARELRLERCDALLVQEYENPRFDVCVALGRTMRIPVFATFQGGQLQYSWTERLVRGSALRRAAGIIIGPRAEADRIAERYGVDRAKIAQIFNPLDVERWRPFDRIETRAVLGIPADARVVVWHGRVLMWRKGLDILLDAWDAVCNDRPQDDLRLILVGSGNDAEDLRRWLNGLRPRGVWWIDQFVSDPDTIRRYLSAADVYAFPSRDEGFPVAPIEAMSAGLPVIAATAPGVTDIFDDGEASGGVLVPTNDAREFATGLARLVDDRRVSEELGRRAMRRAHDAFSLDAIGPRLSALLTNPSR
jgi:glycosyltransferase involved in cell wall biosynthesis